MQPAGTAQLMIIRARWADPCGRGFAIAIGDDAMQHDKAVGRIVVMLGILASQAGCPVLALDAAASDALTAGLDVGSLHLDACPPVARRYCTTIRRPLDPGAAVPSVEKMTPPWRSRPIVRVSKIRSVVRIVRLSARYSPGFPFWPPSLV